MFGLPKNPDQDTPREREQREMASRIQRCPQPRRCAELGVCQAKCETPPTTMGANEFHRMQDVLADLAPPPGFLPARLEECR